MGITAENVANRYNISREDQDHFAVRSHQRAAAAIKDGKFKEEIVPLKMVQKTVDPTTKRWRRKSSSIPTRRPPGDQL